VEHWHRRLASIVLLRVALARSLRRILLVRQN